MRLPSSARRAAGRESGRRSSFPFVVGGILAVIIPLNAALFQVIMLYVEDRSYTWITALYWTVVTMSTLGYGDIVFQSDVGRLFSVAVLLSGILLLLVALPYVSIEFLIEPLRRAQDLSRVPRRAPAGEHGHVVISRYDPIAASLIGRLRTDGIPCYVLEPDPAEGAHLADRGVTVVAGDPESRDTYERLGIERARTVLANHQDTTNTNITLTVREASPDVPIIALAEHEDSTDILELSGCTHVLPLKVRLGEYLANRVSAGLGKADVVGSVKGLQIAEFSARDTPLAGQTVRDTRLRERTGAEHRRAVAPRTPRSRLPRRADHAGEHRGGGRHARPVDRPRRPDPGPAGRRCPHPARWREHDWQRRRALPQEQGGAGPRARPRPAGTGADGRGGRRGVRGATPATARHWRAPGSPAPRRCS